MSQQLRNDPVLTRRLGSSWREIVILELIFDVLRGGSCVSFYFANQLHVETDTEAAQQRMFDGITTDKELVLGYPSAGSIEVDMEIISGPGELTELLMHHPEGSLIVWGKWPARS